MSDGTIGGGAGAGGTGGAGPATPATPAVNPASESPDSGDYKASDISESGNKDSIAGSAAISPGHHGKTYGPCSNMSTENFVSIHNNSIDMASETQNQDLDLKKLLEMIMAMKLLEELKKE